MNMKGFSTLYRDYDFCRILGFVIPVLIPYTIVFFPCTTHITCKMHAYIHTVTHIHTHRFCMTMQIEGIVTFLSSFSGRCNTCNIP